MITAGANSRQVAKQLKVPPFVADKLTAQARSYRLRGLFRALNRLSAADKAIKDPDTLALERRLSDALGLSVSIDHKDEGGRLEIRYRTLEQLDGVCHRLTGVTN